MKRLFLSLALALGIFAIPLPSFATVQSTVDKNIYQGDGYSTSFSFPYNIYLATDLAVYETVVSTSVTTELSLNTNYSVTLTAISGVTGAYTATINLAGGSSPAGALAVGTQLTILRSLPLTQLINISDYSATPAATWNQAFDRGVILTQQMQEQINRAVLAPVNSTSNAGYSLPNPVANNYIGWDATGTFLINITNQPLTITSSPTFAGLTLTGALSSSSTITASGATIGSLNGIVKASAGVLGTANADVDYSIPNGVEVLTNKTFDTAGAGNVLKINGTQVTAKVGSGSVVLATGVKGNSGYVASASGSPGTNNCAKWDANGNLVDAGGTCTTGAGMTYPGSSGIVTTNSSAWTTSISGTSSQFVKGDGSLDSTTYVTGTPWTTASTSGNAATATALAASPTNCSAGSAPQGINASGVAQNCTAYTPATAGSAILAGNGSGSTSNVTIGTGLSFTGGTLSNTVTASNWVPNNIQVFTSSGTWTKPAGVSSVYVKVWGSGGGGYGGSGGSGGGGCGGYSEGYTAVSGNVTVTVDQGGSGGSSSNGVAGGTTSFAGTTTIQSTGGAGGTSSSAGAGGVGSNGQINLTGPSGPSAASQTIYSLWALGHTPTGAGASGTGIGAGGQDGYPSAGAGSPGLVIVYY
jgi:hypothetical protein